MSKHERINQLLKEGLAEAINKEVLSKESLITISYVECTPDLKQAKVGFTVLPDKLAGTVLSQLKKDTHLILPHLRKRVKLRRIPKLIWEFDASEREADKIEKLIKEASE
jgi:ribosome-binding factor A